MKVLVLLSVLFICNASVYANELNLTIDDAVLYEQEQQKEMQEKPLLPNLIDKQSEKEVSVGSGVLIKDESTIDPTEVIDGAEISIEVKTN